MPSYDPRSVRNAFRMPRGNPITGRSSTITNAFVSAIIPVELPTDEEISEVLQILKMEQNKVLCAYCGDPSTEWDHLHPLVANKRPTGYWSSIRNLVPCCGKCNQSKSGRKWREWMKGSAPGSPIRRLIPDLELRFQRLEALDAQFHTESQDFESLVGNDLWTEYWHHHQKVLEAMSDAQKVAEKVKRKLREELKSLRAFDRAKASQEEVVPFEQAIREIESEHR